MCAYKYKFGYFYVNQCKRKKMPKNLKYNEANSIFFVKIHQILLCTPLYSISIVFCISLFIAWECKPLRFCRCFGNRERWIFVNWEIFKLDSKLVSSPQRLHKCSMQCSDILLPDISSVHSIGPNVIDIKRQIFW